MKIIARLSHRFSWINPVAAAGIALSQRTPAVRFIVAADELVAVSPIGNVLKSAIAVAATLCAYVTLASAGGLFISQTAPLTATVGVPMSPVAITASDASGIGSWQVDGSLPPGLALTANEGGNTLTDSGLLDATTPDTIDMDGNVMMGGITTTTPILSGTPTASGSYSFTLTAYEFGGAGGMVSNTYSYTVVVADAAVVAAPVFATQPIAVAVVSGSTVALTAAASGAPSYQWDQDGSAIPGATSATLLINGATSANAGNYTCTATNSSGSTASNAAALSITNTTDVGRLTGLSTRAQVGTGADVLVVGFVVGGAGTTGTKPMLIRGTGPTLASFGVSGVLADPMLTLFQDSTVVAANDNWGGDSQIAAQDAASGAFALSNTSSLDSALYLSGVAPGTYSAMVAGNNGGTGVALAEVYDLTGSGSYNAATPRLTALSTRVRVGTGDNILIVGFVIGGSSAKTVLIRASGPALDQFGVPGTLPDPMLTLYGSDSTAMATNNSWAGDPQIATTAASVQAFTWTSAASNDSALLVTLPPGLYSAGVAGASGDTGVALVEVYEVP
jgi:hypothetical protein